MILGHEAIGEVMEVGEPVSAAVNER